MIKYYKLFIISFTINIQRKVRSIAIEMSELRMMTLFKSLNGNSEFKFKKTVSNFNSLSK